MKKPNIFSFATSELSQDAMFAWLLSWAAPECKELDEGLYEVAGKFVNLLVGETVEVSQIKATRQVEHIDVSAEINDDTFLVIEDKTWTTKHGDQLKRYKECAQHKYNEARPKLFFAYVKTGNEPLETKQRVEKEGYRICGRREILECLKEYSGGNELLCSYREYLRKIENETQSFKDKSITDWSRAAREGFFMKLESRKIGIGIEGWGYVSNPSRGFWGAWWRERDFVCNGRKCSLKLQFEDGTLCFKLSPYWDWKADRDELSTIKYKCHEFLMRKAEGRFPELCRPNRMRIGEFMTIAKVEQSDILGNGKLDMDKVVQKLKQYDDFVAECCSDLEQGN